MHAVTFEAMTYITWLKNGAGIVAKKLCLKDLLLT